MESLKQRWKSIPVTIRKPLVLIVGLALVIISPFTGVLPGPGGIPIFLLGVAILATEFEWAERFRDWTLHLIKLAAQLWRRHKVFGTILLLILIAIAITASIFIYDAVRSYF